MNETLDNLVSATLINLAETGYSDSIIAEHRRAMPTLPNSVQQTESRRMTKL